MRFRPPLCIIDHCARIHYESPIARLGQEQFPRGLVESPPGRSSGLSVSCTGLFQRQSGAVQMRVDPVVAVVEPYFVVTFVSPAGGARLGYLVPGVFFKVFRKCDQPDRLFSVIDRANQILQPARSFVPPVAKQFRVIRSGHDRFAVHPGRQVFHLPAPAGQKMTGVKSRFGIGALRVVGLLHLRLSGYPVVFDPGVDPDAIAVNVGLDVVKIEVMSNITVKVAVVEVPGVPFRGAPYLPGGVGIASKENDA